VGSFRVLSNGVIMGLIEAPIVGLVDGLKVCLFKTSKSGVIIWCFNV
jgi:hypothetical protein